MAIRDGGAFTTLDSVKRLRNIDSTTDDAMIKQQVLAASRYIERYTGRTFVPYISTLYLETPEHRYVELPDDLLTLTSVTIDDIVMDEEDYELLEANQRPYTGIYNRDGWHPSVYSAYAIELLGTWGYHGSPDTMWRSVTTQSTASINGTVTSVIVGDASEIGVYSYIKIGDEMMFVRAVNTVTDTLTIDRAVRGFTAATHTSGDTVYVLDIDPDIEQATAIYASYLYENRDNFGVIQLGGNATQLGRALPDFVVNDIDYLRRVKWFTP